MVSLINLTYMNAKDQTKVLGAGFTIIRKEVIHQAKHAFTRKIKAKTPLQREWHTLEDEFTSTTALEKRMKELLEDPLILED